MVRAHRGYDVARSLVYHHNSNHPSCTLTIVTQNLFTSPRLIATRGKSETARGYRVFALKMVDVIQK